VADAPSAPAGEPYQGRSLFAGCRVLIDSNKEDSMKRLKSFVAGLLCVVIFFALSNSSPGVAKELKIEAAPRSCPECCDVLKPYEGISADDLMRIKYWIKYTKFAHDYRSDCKFFLIDKTGFKRSRGFNRYRMLLYRNSPEYDYKDLTVITDPQNIKGLAILAWTYKDPKKDQDTWLWRPTLRKIRRVSQSEADDSALGSDWTTEEMSTRRWEDETYKMMGAQKFPGFISKYNGKTYYQGVDCWVVEATPKRKPWYYSKRIVWIDKRHGGNIYDEVYDPLGRKFKEILKVYEIWPDKNCVPQVHLEAHDLNTGHRTINEIGNIKFNAGQDENFFTEKTLMRTKW
jgi:hypothetical protein